MWAVRRAHEMGHCWKTEMDLASVRSSVIPRARPRVAATAEALERARAQESALRKKSAKAEAKATESGEEKETTKGEMRGVMWERGEKHLLLIDQGPLIFFFALVQ
jgi:hypothetical protein